MHADHNSEHAYIDNFSLHHRPRVHISASANNLTIYSNYIDYSIISNCICHSVIRDGYRTYDRAAEADNQYR